MVRPTAPAIRDAVANEPDGDSPLEAEALEISERHGVHTSVQTHEQFGAGNWSGDAQIFVKGKPGSGLTFDLPVEKAGRYQLSVYLTMAPDFGQIQPRLDGERLGGPIDLYAPRVIASGRVVLATRTLRAGRHAIEAGRSSGRLAIIFR